MRFARRNVRFDQCLNCLSSQPPPGLDLLPCVDGPGCLLVCDLVAWPQFCLLLHPNLQHSAVPGVALDPDCDCHGCTIMTARLFAPKAAHLRWRAMKNDLQY